MADGRSALRRHHATRTQTRFGAEGPGRSFAVGERVFHAKFGYGRVRSSDGDRLEIEFEKAGLKRVLAGFVENV